MNRKPKKVELLRRSLPANDFKREPTSKEGDARLILSLPWSSSSEEHQKKDACPELETKKVYTAQTAQNVFEQDRKKYDLVVQGLRDQLPVRHISKTAQVSFSTISAIRRHAGLSDENERVALVDTIRCAARVVAERVLEMGEQMNARDSSVALGILSDKLLIMQGEPNFISANRSEEVWTHQQFADLLASLPPASVIEVGGSLQETDETPKVEP